MLIKKTIFQVEKCFESGVIMAVGKFSFIIMLLTFMSCEKVSEQQSSSKDGISSKIELRSSSHFSNSIGEIVNGDVEITVSISDIKQSWSNFLLDESGVSLDFDQIEVRTSNGLYYLHGTDFDNGSSVIELAVDNGYVYEAMIDGVSKTVTCSGCSSTGPSSAGECDVQGNKDGWYCTTCSTNDCTKTTSLSFLTGGILEYSN